MAFGLSNHQIGLKAAKILQRPQPPYHGFPVKGPFETLREMRLPQYCTSDNYNSRGGHCEGVERPLEAKIKEVEQSLVGLELTDGILSSSSLATQMSEQ